MKTYFALILAFLCLAAPTQAEVIYSNTHLNYINPFLPYLLPSGSDFTVGDLVTLGGSSRHVTDFTAGFFATLLDSNGNPIQSFTVELSLYFYQVGPENQVGPQIGSRITRTAVVLDDGSFNP